MLFYNRIASKLNLVSHPCPDSPGKLVFSLQSCVKTLSKYLSLDHASPRLANPLARMNEIIDIARERGEIREMLTQCVTFVVPAKFAPEIVRAFDAPEGPAEALASATARAIRAAYAEGEIAACFFPPLIVPGSKALVVKPTGLSGQFNAYTFDLESGQVHSRTLITLKSPILAGEISDCGGVWVVATAGDASENAKATPQPSTKLYYASQTWNFDPEEGWMNEKEFARYKRQIFSVEGECGPMRFKGITLLLSRTGDCDLIIPGDYEIIRRNRRG